MELQHLNAKIYVDGNLSVDPARFIEVFHAWVRDKTLDGLLIDVADYRHVPAGPGVMLIGLADEYSMDQAGKRYGLRYNRKGPLDGSNDDRIRYALRSAAIACQLLEAEFASEGPLKFSRHELDLLVNDRAFAPNTPETFESCKPEIEQSLTAAFGHSDFQLKHDDDARRLFAVKVTSEKPIDLAALAK